MRYAKLLLEQVIQNESLYTNDNDIIYEHRRCLGLNGINVALTEADALDRSISIELKILMKIREGRKQIYGQSLKK